MKKLFIALLLFLALCGSALAVNDTEVVTDVTSTQIAAENNRVLDSGTVIITLVCTADSGAGTYASKVVPIAGYYPNQSLNSYNLTGYYLYQVGRTPGGTQPTGNYTVTITDSRGFPIDLGLLTSNGSASTPQLTGIYSTGTVYPTVRGPLTVAITGNSVYSAIITLDLIFKDH
jgi:hypothetical protein